MQDDSCSYDKFQMNQTFIQKFYENISAIVVDSTILLTHVSMHLVAENWRLQVNLGYIMLSDIPSNLQSMPEQYHYLSGIFFLIT